LVSQEYFVSTKADGYRFMMLFSNGFEKLLKIQTRKIIPRNIYFVDSSLDFWYIKPVFFDKEKENIPNEYRLLQQLPGVLNIDKCLLDGELLIWGAIEKEFDEDGKIKLFRITQDGNVPPFISFLAFDILYGPTNPQFKSETELKNKLIKGRLGTEEPNERVQITGYTQQSEIPMSPNLEFGSTGAMFGFKG
jgi:hypothetical protein